MGYIDLLEKADVSLDKSLENFDYQINILYQLQNDMNKHPKKYSIKDVEVIKKMRKQLKNDLIFTKPDDPKYKEMPLNQKHAIPSFNNLEIYLSLLDLDSQEGFSNSKKFYEERISSGIHYINLDFYKLEIDLYQKAFQL